MYHSSSTSSWRVSFKSSSIVLTLDFLGFFGTAGFAGVPAPPPPVVVGFGLGDDGEAGLTGVVVGEGGFVAGEAGFVVFAGAGFFFFGAFRGGVFPAAAGAGGAGGAGGGGNGRGT